MERFSNSRAEYWNQIISELSDLENSNSEEFRFQFLELDQLLTYGFSIIQLKGNRSFLKLAIWNAEFDNERFDKGIYNIDRLAITNHKIELAPFEWNKLEEQLKSDLELTDDGGITLDGRFCRFESGKKRIEWNSNQEINENLIDLSEMLRNKASLQQNG